MRGIALDGSDEVWNQIGPSLVLIDHFAPGGLGIFIQALEIIVAAPWEADEH